MEPHALYVHTMLSELHRQLSEENDDISSPSSSDDSDDSDWSGSTSVGSTSQDEDGDGGGGGGAGHAPAGRQQKVHGAAATSTTTSRFAACSAASPPLLDRRAFRAAVRAAVGIELQALPPPSISVRGCRRPGLCGVFHVAAAPVNGTIAYHSASSATESGVADDESSRSRSVNRAGGLDDGGGGDGDEDGDVEDDDDEDNGGNTEQACDGCITRATDQHQRADILVCA
jgi:hypothetical protein